MEIHLETGHDVAKHPPAYQYYPADFELATRHMTPAEVGCYQRLLNHQWANGPLPESRLWRIVGATEEDWSEIWETISCKFSKGPGGLLNRRLEAVRQEQDEFRRKKAEAGSKGGTATALLQHRRSNTGSKQGSKKVALQSSSSSLTTTSTTLTTKDVSSELNSEPPPVLEFQTVGKIKLWQLTAEKVAEWHEDFPNLDIEAECRKARAWLVANPTRRKTARGMTRFLVGWLGRSQDSGKGSRSRQPETDWSKVEGIRL